MGEYVNFRNDSVKIGTCEDLYYTNFNQFAAALSDIKPDGYYSPLEYVNPKNGYRFRFPFPDEDNFTFRELPGDFNYDRGFRLLIGENDFTRDLISGLDHYGVSLESNLNGERFYTSLPCPYDAAKMDANKAVYFHSHGYNRGILHVEIVRQKVMPVDGEPGKLCLWVVYRCPACGAMARLGLEGWEKLRAEIEKANNPMSDELSEVLRRASDGYKPKDMPTKYGNIIYMKQPEPEPEPEPTKKQYEYKPIRDIARDVKKALSVDGVKASVVTGGGSYTDSIVISLMSAPWPAFINGVDPSRSVNPYYIKEDKNLTDEAKNFFLKAWELLKPNYYDNSDAMTDYFDTSFYVRFQVGQWDKPFKLVV